MYVCMYVCVCMCVHVCACVCMCVCVHLIINILVSNQSNPPIHPSSMNPSPDNACAVGTTKPAVPIATDTPMAVARPTPTPTAMPMAAPMLTPTAEPNVAAACIEARILNQFWGCSMV